MKKIDNSEQICICIVIGGLNKGGVEKYVKSIFSHMDRDPFELHLVVHYIEDDDSLKDFINLGFIIHKFHRLKGSKLKRINIIEYKELFMGYSFDIVYNNVIPNLLPLFFAYRNKVPVRILHSHNDYKEVFASLPVVSRLLRKIGILINVKFATKYYACGIRAAESVYGKGNNKINRVIIRPNAIDTRLYSFNKDKRNKIRKELKVFDSPLFGNIGRFEDDQKNQEFILDIFREILKVRNDAKLILIGDGKKKAEIKRIVNQYGIDKSVIFTGNVSDTSGYYSAMDVFIFPSKWEGFSIASVEAQCSGLYGVMNSSLSSEMNILGLFKEISLDEATETWAKEAVSLLECERVDRSSEIIAKDFDVKKQASQFQRELIRLYEESI